MRRAARGVSSANTTTQSPKDGSMSEFTQTLRDLLGARGPSGYETAPAAVWSAAAQAFGARVETDLVGTTSARVAPRARVGQPVQGHAAGGSESDAPTRRLVVMGHIDEIGLIVTHIGDEGY